MCLAARKTSQNRSFHSFLHYTIKSCICLLDFTKKWFNLVFVSRCISTHSRLLFGAVRGKMITQTKGGFRMNSYVTSATIKSLREKKHMTQAELAQVLMVSDKTVSKWETGKGLPDISLLEPLSNALGI